MLIQFLRQSGFFYAQLTGSEENGQGLIEYALIILLIAMGVIFILGVLGGEILNAYQFITESIPVGE